MNVNNYPENVQRFVSELIRKNVINSEDAEDKMLINYLSTQKYDEDYIRSMEESR